MPDGRKQFRVLYGDFLFRMIDLEILSANGEIRRLLVQFSAMLLAFGLTFAIVSVPKYMASSHTHAQLAVKAWVEEEFLLAATMAIAGLFSVLAWNTVLPSRRDCIILGLLPVKVRTIFAAKIAAIVTALGISVFALNFFTGIYFPFVSAPENAGFVQTLRSLSAYWVALFAAGAFVGFGLLAIQGLAAGFLPYRLFLRASGLLQLFSFFGILGVFFLKPSFPNPEFNAWLPSFWFFGLFQTLNGNAAFAPLAARAGFSLAVVLASAAATFTLAYSRNIRKIVEQPDIEPADRSRPAAGFGTRLVKGLLPKPIDRAIVLFTARGIARSRQHRLILAAYLGIGLAIALAYARQYFYGPATWDQRRLYAPWYMANHPFLAGSMVLLFFAIIGMRAVCAVPIALPANWVFRLTVVHSPSAYFAAVRKAIFSIAAVPVWIVAAAVFFAIWPTQSAIQHVSMMLATGILVGELALARFRKIPFACSYLPGKANLHIRLGAYGALFLSLVDQGVELEFWTMHKGTRFGVLFTLVAAVALWAWRRTRQLSAGEGNLIQFDDLERPVVDVLDLRRDGVWSKSEAYIDQIRPNETT